MVIYLSSSGLEFGDSVINDCLFYVSKQELPL